MTNDEAREAIVANGYQITRELPRFVSVRERPKKRNVAARYWSGVNFLDLAQSFKLHQRKAGVRPQK